MSEKKHNGTKLAVLLMVLVMLIGATIGGTLAWLIANTDPVVNTFTVGNITITLDEAAIAEANRSSIKMVPGTEIAKDPKVTVKANSEACWLFIKVETAGNVVLGHGAADADTYITYEIGTNDSACKWEQLMNGSEAVPGVYYMPVSAATADQEFQVLAGNIVKVPSTVTKAMMDALTAGTTTTPKLTFTAYAVQQANGSGTFDALAAWNIAMGLNPDGTQIPPANP